MILRTAFPVYLDLRYSDISYSIYYHLNPQVQELEFGEWDIPQLYVVGLLVVSEAGGTARYLILTLLSADSLILWLMNSVISSKGVLS